MKWILRLGALILTLCAVPVAAQDLSGLARLIGAGSYIKAVGQDVSMSLALSQPVPWRLRLLDGPPRLIMDFREVDWSDLAAMPVEAGAIAALRAGVFRPSWSRLVIELNAPMQVIRSQMVTTDGRARVDLTLAPTDADAFSDLAKLPEPPEWQLPKSADMPAPMPRAQGTFRVVLDPGHGGLDPGAQRGGYNEADLVLGFARELKELLLRDGRFDVIMTREDDVFVPLEARISIARAAQADVFLSLHADAVSQGDAVGATIYTLSDTASDKASQTLAERHDRDDLLAGVDLTAQDDLVATVLMDMARTTTAPRTARLSASLAAAISGAGLKMHRHPEQSAGFSVLKSPDIPSVLVELGFLSSAKDLAKLTDATWRQNMAMALRDGIVAWGDQDRMLRATPLR
jgi:N-acetylmuramoyl-L-alanine amidase